MKLATLQALLREDSGQDMMEYALMAAMVSQGAVAAMDRFAAAISSAFSLVTSDVASVILPRH